MSYFIRVRMASFFAGAAAASFVGFYVLHNDYKVAHESISKQMKNFQESLDGRVSSLESLKRVEVPQQVEVSE